MSYESALHLISHRRGVGLSAGSAAGIHLMTSEALHTPRWADSLTSAVLREKARIEFIRLDQSEPSLERLPAMEELDTLNGTIDPACLQQPPLAIDIIKREWPAGFLSLSSGRW